MEETTLFENVRALGLSGRKISKDSYVVRGSIDSMKDLCEMVKADLWKNDGATPAPARHPDGLAWHGEYVLFDRHTYRGQIEPGYVGMINRLDEVGSEYCMIVHADHIAKLEEL